jgi:hypothetical protein
VASAPGGGPASESRRLCRGDGSPRTGQPQEVVHVACDPRRSATCQLVLDDRSGAKLVPNVAGPPRTIRASRHAEGSSVCSVGFS